MQSQPSSQADRGWYILTLTELISGLILSKPDFLQPDNFYHIFQANAYLGKYLKENSSSENNQQLSVKYFVNSFLIIKLLPKVLRWLKGCAKCALIKLQQY